MGKGRGHPCAAECGGRADVGGFACRSCWYRLPGDFRAAILHTRRGTTSHSVAQHNAHEWYRANPRPVGA